MTPCEIVHVVGQFQPCPNEFLEAWQRHVKCRVLQRLLSQLAAEKKDFCTMHSQFLAVLSCCSVRCRITEWVGRIVWQDAEELKRELEQVLGAAFRFAHSQAAPGESRLFLHA